MVECSDKTWSTGKDRVPEELWMEVPNIVKEAVIRTIPKKKQMQKGKMVAEAALQIAEKRT